MNELTIFFFTLPACWFGGMGGGADPAGRTRCYVLPHPPKYKNRSVIQ